MIFTVLILYIFFKSVKVCYFRDENFFKFSFSQGMALGTHTNGKKSEPKRPLTFSKARLSSVVNS
jgi:hypothetical protein